MDEKQQKYGIFWNDELTDEAEYIKRIQKLCSRYKELTKEETREVLVFFGRCFTNIAWQKVVDIFSVPALEYFFANENEQMRKTVMPASRIDYDRVRTCFLFGFDAWDWKEDPNWDNRPTLLSEWRKKVYGSYDSTIDR